MPEPARKTQAKPAGLPAHLTPGNPGNSGGKPGRSGRKPTTLKTFLASLRQDADVHEAMRKAAVDASSRGFAPVLKTMTDYDDEKPAQRVQLDLSRIKTMSDDELLAVVSGKRNGNGAASPASNGAHG